MVKKPTCFPISFSIFLILILTVTVSLSGAENSNRPIHCVADLDGDGETEEYSLANFSLSVREGDHDLWRSPAAWHVDNFALGDANNDGSTDLVITLWKKDSFGPVRPFWKGDEDRSYKNHLFVYNLMEDSLQAVWCSSNLDRPIVSFAIRDVNGDGLNELVVAEGQYRKVTGERYKLDTNSSLETSVWQWDEWGFRALPR